MEVEKEVKIFLRTVDDEIKVKTYRNTDKNTTMNTIVVAEEFSCIIL